MRKSDSATAQETAPERAKWEANRRKHHREFVRKLPLFHKSSTFMDYLHGSVLPEEATVACLYEYARESKAVWEAAKRCREFKSTGRSVSQSAIRAVEEMPQRPYLMNEVTTFLECASFPKKDWQELDSHERKQIMRACHTKMVRPLAMPDAWTLHPMGILKRFEELSKEAAPRVEDVPPGSTPKPIKVLPSLLRYNESLWHAIFTVDFSESETHLVERFRKWLKLAENQDRLDQYKKPRPSLADKSLDRLKDLAAWRLYREHNNECAAANEFARANRKSRKPFRDAKQQGGIASDVADLFGEDADARKAAAGAWKHLCDLMPEEFATPISTLAWVAGLDSLT